MGLDSTYIPEFSRGQIDSFTGGSLDIQRPLHRLLSRFTLQPIDAQSLVSLAEGKIISGEAEISLQRALSDIDLEGAQVLFLARRLLAAILDVSENLSGAEFEGKTRDHLDAHKTTRAALGDVGFRLFQTISSSIDPESLADEPATSEGGTSSTIIDAIRSANKTAREIEHARIGNQLRIATQNPYLIVKMLLQDAKRHIFTYDFEGQSYFGVSSRGGAKNSISYLHGDIFTPISGALSADKEHTPRDHQEGDIYLLGLGVDKREIVMRIRGNEIIIVLPPTESRSCLYFQTNNVLYFHRFGEIPKKQMFQNGMSVLHGPTVTMAVSRGDKYFKNDGGYKVVRLGDGKVFSIPGGRDTIADLYPDCQLPDSGIISRPDSRPPWNTWPPHIPLIIDLTK